MQVSIKVWREGGNVLVRNDRFHINTYGRNLDEALENFHDAFLMALEEHNELKGQKHELQLTLLMPYPIESQRKEIEIAE